MPLTSPAARVRSACHASAVEVSLVLLQAQVPVAPIEVQLGPLVSQGRSEPLRHSGVGWSLPLQARSKLPRLFCAHLECSADLLTVCAKGGTSSSFPADMPASAASGTSACAHAVQPFVAPYLSTSCSRVYLLLCCVLGGGHVSLAGPPQRPQGLLVVPPWWWLLALHVPRNTSARLQ
eukprot:943440-Amphidinium_carterae.1